MPSRQHCLNLNTLYCYRPKRSFGQGNIFTSVCLSTGGGVWSRGVSNFFWGLQFFGGGVSGIRSTFGRYASYWNAFLLELLTTCSQMQSISTNGVEISNVRSQIMGFQKFISYTCIMISAFLVTHNLGSQFWDFHTNCWDWYKMTYGKQFSKSIAFTFKQ